MTGAFDPPPAERDPIAAAKSLLRARLLAERRRRPLRQRSADARANGSHLLRSLASATTVAAFLPLPTEPLAIDLLDALVARGIRVIVPVVIGPQPLDWVAYPTPTRPGVRGIAEPIGERLEPTAIRTATDVLVPALAVDRAGRRLGRGGGHYDRTLALLTSATRRIAVLFDDELVGVVPADVFDERVNAAVTPTRGLVLLAP